MAGSDAPDIDKQREFYDRRWAEVEFSGPLAVERAAVILGAFARLRLDRPKILDLGCGRGWLAGVLGEAGPTTAVDLSEEAIRTACKRFPWVRFAAGDVFTWEPPETSFDVVVSQEVIEHVEDQAAYLDRACSLLRPSGYMILTTPNARTLRAMERARAWSNQPIENTLTARQLARLVRPRFRILQMRSFVGGHGHKGLYRLAHSVRLRRLFGPLYEGLWLRLGFGLHTLVVAQRRA